MMGKAESRTKRRGPGAFVLAQRMRMAGDGLIRCLLCGHAVTDREGEPIVDAPMGASVCKDCFAQVHEDCSPAGRRRREAIVAEFVRLSGARGRPARHHAYEFLANGAVMR